MTGHSTMQPDDTANAERLSVLTRLRQEGALSDSEFELLEKQVIAEERRLNKGADGGRQRPESISTFSLFVVAAICLIALDYIKGPLLPDDLYCLLGAGNSVIIAGRTEANAWSSNNGCGASKPECATSWIHHSATEACVHGTLWDAISSELKRF
jgi:hypothetical protein